MEKKKAVIMHVISGDEWAKEKNNAYLYPDSLKTEGFIHCATSEQILGAVEFLYKEKVDLKLLVIDPDLVTAKIIYEDLHQTRDAFPHIYGPLNISAVVDVLDFEPNERGVFEISNFV